MPETPVHPFDQLVRTPESRIRLAGAALLFAKDEYPEIDTAEYLRRLESLAEHVREANATSIEQQISALRSTIAEGAGFTGDREIFGDPDGSYLNCVIDTRRGLPISICAIWIDVAASVGWAIRGINFPGHFLVSLDTDQGRLVLDPFNNGIPLSVDNCRHLLHTMFGDRIELTPEHLEPVGTLAILERMLGNLYSVYVHESDWPRAARVLSRTVAMRPNEFQFIAELARVHMLAGDFPKAGHALDHAEELAASFEDAQLLETHRQELRRLIEESN